jgi:peroxiredoxin
VRFCIRFLQDNLVAKAQSFRWGVVPDSGVTGNSCGAALRVSTIDVFRGVVLAAMLAAPARPAPVTLVGKPAPDFALKSSAGGNLRLSEFRGQVVLINFWARWAGDSRLELTALDRINTTYNRAGLVVLAVSVDEDARRARDFADGMKLGFPVLFDTTSALGRDYSIEKMPVTILVDRSGVVRYVNAGFKRGDERLYLGQIRELLRE